MSEGLSFSDVHFRVVSDDAMQRLFRDEFGALRDIVEPDITFYICRPRQKNASDIKDRFYKDVGSRDARRIVKEWPRMTLSMTVSFEERVLVLVEVARARDVKVAGLLPSPFQRLVTKKYLSMMEFEYGYILYSAILWVIFALAIRRGDVFLHASSIVQSGEAVAFSGSGGVGKTTISAWLLTNTPFSFLSDDLLPVDKTGMAYRTGLFVHVYPYNEFERHMWSKIGHGSFGVSYLHWHLRRVLLGPKGVCRRISPDLLYGTNPGSSGKLRKLVWLVRRPKEPTGIEDVPAEAFVQDHLKVLRDEMPTAFQVFAGTGAELQQELFGGPFEEAVSKQLLEVLGNIPIKKFNVSMDRSVSENCQKLLSEALS